MYSSVTGDLLVEKAKEELRLRAALIEEVWTRVLRTYPDAGSDLSHDAVVEDAVRRLESDLDEIKKACRPRVVEKYLEDLTPIDEQLRSSATSLAADLRLTLAGIQSREARGHVEDLSEQRAVFVVHGQDDAAKESVARYLEKLGLDPVILHEQPSAGRTIIEKFEAHSRVAYAVVLLTPDDLGKAKTEPELQPRARQNVIFELGYFCGILGRTKVCVLHGGVELPTDYSGVVYIPLDREGAWKLLLARELHAAGLGIDLNLAL